MDTVYPEPLSRLYRRTVRKKVHKSNAFRYKTQPITFAEIQEVDEETANDEVQEKLRIGTSNSEINLNTKFRELRDQRNKDSDENRASTSRLDIEIAKKNKSNIGMTESETLMANSNSLRSNHNNSTSTKESVCLKIDNLNVISS